MGVDRLVRAKISKVQRAPAASGARLRACARQQPFKSGLFGVAWPGPKFDEKDLAGCDRVLLVQRREITLF